jgi:hypothetical protein
MSGGFSTDSMKVIRANRSLLKKRKFSDIKKIVIETSGKTEVEFKKVSTEELAEIKARIRKEAKKNAERDITIYCVCFLILLLLAGFLFIQMS